MNPHAEQIKAERSHMELTGQTRSQARAQVYAAKAMTSFQESLRQAEGLKALPVKPTPLKMDISVGKHEPNFPAPLDTATRTEGKDGGGGGGEGETTSGTFVTPYVMGAGRTTSDPSPADDSWSAASPPVGTDGVILKPPRFHVVAGTNAVVDGTTFVSYALYIYTRSQIFDSAGRIVSVSAESSDTFLISRI